MRRYDALSVEYLVYPMLENKLIFVIYWEGVTLTGQKYIVPQME